MNVLLTGATGFLGEYLLYELLHRGHSVWALYRDEAKKDKTTQFISLLGVQNGLGNLHWFQGDILEADTQWEEWSKACPGLDSVDYLLHSAASLRFRSNDSGEPYLTNVQGTKALRDLVSRKPMHVYFVSTAFVCGYVGKGVVYEVNHPRGNFVNDYEQSKWEAEQLWDGEATILRPGIIVGHSETGRCTSFTGFYMVAKALQLLDQVIDNIPGVDRHDLDIDLPADPNGTANFVPVDYAAKACISIMEDGANHKKIFHLTHPDPPLHSWFHELLCRRFNVAGMRFAGREAIIPEPRNEIHRQLRAQVGKFLPYFSNTPIFDRSNTDGVVPDLPISPITEGFIHKLIDYAIEKNWGK